MVTNTKPNATEFVAEKMVTEMKRQGINRTQMATILGWPISRVRTRLDGKKITAGDSLDISHALGVDVSSLFVGMMEPGAVSSRKY